MAMTRPEATALPAAQVSAAQAATQSASQTAEQVDLSRRFASPVADKFAEGPWLAGLGGAPVLSGCAAVFECALASQQVAGDHLLFIGRVLRLTDLSVAPLLFQGGHYRMLGEVL